MSLYELLLILDPELEEEEISQAVDRVKQMITDRGGSEESTQVRGRRRLAYPIRKKRDGTMVVTRFEMPPQEVGGMVAALRVDEKHLRVMVTRAEPEQPAMEHAEHERREPARP